MKKIILTLLLTTFLGGTTMAAEVKKQTAGHDALGQIAPLFAELNDDVLFGQVWSRTDKLSLKNRSMLTVTALMTKGIFDNSLKYHIQNAKNNGVTQDEMAEMLTHLAFYSGWPNAWAAFNMMKEVYANTDINAERQALFDQENVFGKGSENTAYAKYFIGKSYLNPLTPKGAVVPVTNVTFEPATRNNWHIHHAKQGGGQTLICVAGTGIYQAEGQAPQLLKPGMVVSIPAGVKHWHGAVDDSWFAHLAIENPGVETSNEWLEPVDDKAYAEALSQAK